MSNKFTKVPVKNSGNLRKLEINRIYANNSESEKPIINLKKSIMKYNKLRFKVKIPI